MPNQVVSYTAEQVRYKVSDLSRTAAHKIDENRGAAANGIEKAATAIRRNAQSLPGGGKVTDFANAAAKKLSATADYVRGHDVDWMVSDLKTLVKSNPGRTLFAAAALGFVLGRAFRRHN